MRLALDRHDEIDEIGQLSRAVEPAACDRFLSMIDADAARLDRLVSRLLELARLEAVATALDNLLANARQYAAAGTTITVTVELDHVRARLAVHNLGPPISPAVQTKLWQRFFTTRGGRGGSGLGLAIERAVAAGHGGTVGLTSGSADGTTFWLDLPRRAPA